MGWIDVQAETDRQTTVSSQRKDVNSEVEIASWTLCFLEFFSINQTNESETESETNMQTQRSKFLYTCKYDLWECITFRDVFTWTEVHVCGAQPVLISSCLGNDQAELIFN